MIDKPLTGRAVLMIFVGAFGVIIAVNLVLAYQAIHTFPGLEVQNSYVASQTFDADRRAQQALGWDVTADLAGGVLTLDISGPGGRPAAVGTLAAMIGRPTDQIDDQDLVLTRTRTGFTAPVTLAPGKWHLRLNATATDGTAFQQRLTLFVKG
jgi:nitrogen fixation protein FixH